LAAQLPAQTQLHSWTALYDGAGGIDRSVAAAVNDAGDVCVAGTSRNLSGNDDLLVTKLSPDNGVLLWERRYNGTGSGTDQAAALALDPANNPVVVGASANASGDLDIIALKLDAASGAVLWQTRLGGEGNADDLAASVAVDPAGDVVLCGSVRNAGGDDDFYVTKLNGATGETRWTFQENGDGTAPQDRAAAVAVDSAGDIFVTGYRRNASGNDDFFTVKLAGETGAKRWQSILDGVGNGRDHAARLGVASGGDVVVTGSSRGAEGNDDYLTLKLRGLDGSILWQSRYNGPANDSDTPAALTVAEDGAAVVTGVSWNTTNQDIYTAKYDADGALLWDQRYNGPSNRADAGLGDAAV
jgi:hypothetical protein